MRRVSAPVVVRYVGLRAKLLLLIVLPMLAVIYYTVFALLHDLTMVRRSAQVQGLQRLADDLAVVSLRVREESAAAINLSLHPGASTRRQFEKARAALGAAAAGLLERRPLARVRNFGDALTGELGAALERLGRLGNIRKRLTQTDFDIACLERRIECGVSGAICAEW